MSAVPILYEDEHILAVNKPAGLVVHSDGRTEELTLVDWFLGNYPESKGVGEPIETTDGKVIDRSGIVHRLDRDTSGVMLLAKTKEGHAHLKAQFQNRETKKIYLAVVYGSLKQSEGVIDRPIGRNKNDFRKWTAERGARGEMREAKTEYTVLERFEHKGEQYSLVEVRPLTGRTHQIRVHMKAIGYPLVCDALYASKRPPALGFERTALHAKLLVFRNLKGEEVTVEAPIPHDFEHCCQ